MNSSNGKWETVVNKKKSQITKSDVKKAQQKFIDGEKVPKIDKKDPIQLDETVYSAGFESRKFAQESDYNTDDEKYPSRYPYEDVNTPTKSPRVIKKREKKVPKPTPLFDMEGKISKLDPALLKKELKEIESKFPNQHLIWLKDITEWMQQNLTGPSDKGDIAYLNKKEDYPSCALHEEVKNILTKLMRRCDTKILSAYFVSLMASLTTAVQQAHATVAYRILIQILYTVQPNILVDCCNEVVHGKSRNGDTYLAVMWGFSQITSSLKDGMAVWWSSMFSDLDKKHHAAAAIHYLDKILNLFKDSAVEKPIVTSDQMVHILEVMVSEESPLQHTPSLMDMVKSHFNTLMRMLLCDGHEKRAEHVFEELLPTLRQHEDPNVREKICELLLECLYSSKNCFDSWINNMLRHLRESSVLLKYIQNNKDEVKKKLASCRKYGRGDVLRKYVSVNLENFEKANERGRLDKKAGFKDCKKVCAALLRDRQQVKSESSKIWKFLKYTFLLLLVAVTVDIYQNGSYKDSRREFVLKKIGIEEHCFVAYEYGKNITGVVYAQLSKHAPCCYGKISYYVDPAIAKISEYALISGAFIYKHTTPVREYLNEVLPPILEKVSYFLSEQYRIISGLIISNYQVIAPQVEEKFTSLYSWLSVNIPLAYNYIVSLLISAKNNIYQLNPQAFDNLLVMLADTYNYVIKMTPVVLESISHYTHICAGVVQENVSKGQFWLQQYFVNASPAAAK